MWRDRTKYQESIREQEERTGACLPWRRDRTEYQESMREQCATRRRSSLILQGTPAPHTAVEAGPVAAFTRAFCRL